MKSKFPKKLLACLFKLAGIYYALYIGVWTMGIHNLYATIQELLAGNLSITSLQFVKMWLLLSFPFLQQEQSGVWATFYAANSRIPLRNSG